MDNLLGGNSNQVKKDGQTVLRKTGKWSPFVHSLLQYLTANGFQESPVFIESDDDIERLSYIAGDVGNYPLKPEMLSDTVVIDAAKLLRKFHDVTQDFVVPPDAQFFLPVQSLTDYEVICHNDFAPYNCVFENGRIVGIIDFDTAAPGKRIWDIAYAVYRFVPLMTDTHCRDIGFETVPDRGHRLKLFCDTYGLEERETLLLTVIERIEALVASMRETQSNLDHIPFYLEDLAYIRANRQGFSDEIMSA
jgi:hypothetical protein